MDRTTLKGRLIAILRQIQADSHLECPLLAGASKPLENLPKFDSKVRPIAATILPTSRKKSPAPRSVHPARTAENKLAPQPQHPRGQVRHPARRQDDEARVVGDQIQAPELLLGRPADPAVGRGQLERARLPADQRNLNL